MNLISNILKKLTNFQELSAAEASSLFDAFFSSEIAISDAQIGAYLFSTATRTIEANELFGAASSLRAHMKRVTSAVSSPILDTCGTGGSGLQAFNTSTVAAFIISAAGQPVAKHGNRAATSLCGSSDLLQALGVSIDIPVEHLGQCLADTNFCFMFAPNHHPATKRVQMIRRDLGFRTIFNFLGPLANPAGATLQVLGVSNTKILPAVAETLLRLGSARALVVCGEDGLDEITLTGRTSVFEVKDNKIFNYEIAPEDFGLSRMTPEQIRGAEPATSAKLTGEILAGKKGPLRDLVVINAAAGLYVAGLSDSIKAGVAMAEMLIDSGTAANHLTKIISSTHALCQS